ncbi:MAG: glycosyltransferase [Bacillus sp. (in: firmicutes)]
MIGESIGYKRRIKELNMKISVIIPVYNSQNTIMDAIESVVSQKREQIRLEIIIINDGSVDSSQEVIVPYIEKYSDKEIHIIYQYQENKGVSAARNAGLRLATGDYIAFLDSDDIWIEGKLKKQLELFQEDKSLGIVYGQYINRVIYTDKKVERFVLKHFYEGDIYIPLLKGNFIATSSMIMTREVFHSVGFFDEELTLAEDYDYWLRIAKKFKGKYSKEPLLIKTFTGENNLSGGRSLKMHRFARKVVNKNLEESTISIEKKKEIIDLLDTSLVYDFIYEGQRKNAWNLIGRKLLKDKLINKQMVIFFFLAFLPRNTLDHLQVVNSKLKIF